jgi:tetratricopeptide (TPR) repeat protein
LPQAPPGTGDLRREEYLAATAVARRAALEELRARRSGDVIVFLLGEQQMFEDFAPDGHYLLGEGYRLRNGEGDAQRALEQYQASITTAPEFAPAWGALGRVYARLGDREQAVAHLERFIELAPDSKDAPFARQALETLRGPAPQPGGPQ